MGPHGVSRPWVKNRLKVIISFGLQHEDVLKMCISSFRVRCCFWQWPLTFFVREQTLHFFLLRGSTNKVARHNANSVPAGDPVASPNWQRGDPPATHNSADVARDQ